MKIYLVQIVLNIALVIKELSGAIETYSVTEMRCVKKGTTYESVTVMKVLLATD